MSTYFETLIPIAGGVVLAWFTGSFRKYGHYLERLNDLAAKMPADSPARAKLDEAVQEEAARLLSKPTAIRHCETILLTIFCLALIGYIYTDLTAQGMGPREVGLAIWGYVLMAFVLALIGVVAEFHVRSLIRSTRSSRGTKAHAPEPSSRDRLSAASRQPGVESAGVEPDEPAEIDVRNAPLPEKSAATAS